MSAGTGVPGDEQKVWRYMSFSHFESMLQNKQLWLARIDLLGDRWEMSPSHTQLAMACKQTALHAVGSTLAGSQEAVARLVPIWRQRTFISCWTAQPDESHAFWQVYAGKEGVAIQTTLAKLRASLPALTVDFVRYGDPEQRATTEEIPLTGLALEKRTMFSYEHEVRVIAKPHQPWPDRGYGVPWDPELIVESIYVHPDADQPFMDGVSRKVEQYAPALKHRVYWSAMRTPPPL